MLGKHKYGGRGPTNQDPEISDLYYRRNPRTRTTRIHNLRTPPRIRIPEHLDPQPLRRRHLLRSTTLLPDTDLLRHRRPLDQTPQTIHLHRPPHRINLSHHLDLLPIPPTNNRIRKNRLLVRTSHRHLRTHQHRDHPRNPKKNESIVLRLPVLQINL